MRKFMPILFLTAAALCGGAGEEAPALRPDRFANWYALGETVTFKPVSGAVPATLTGRVLDSAGNTVAERTVDAAELKSGGWSWKPEAPGFYRVRFSSNGAPLEETFEVRHQPGAPAPFPTIRLPRREHNVAVMPSQAIRPPEECSPMFGLGLHIQLPHSLPLAKYIGVSAIRIHPMRWVLFERSRGQYDWRVLDHFMDSLRKDGFRDFMLNPYGTPHWASRGGTPGASLHGDAQESYAPKEMSIWTDYIRALMEHCPDVTLWELWNEAGFPGTTAFWRDTPEKYAELMIAGSREVRRLRPDAKIVVCYMTRQFYKKMIELGAGEVFDIQSVHGRGVQPYLEVKDLYQDSKLKPRPWIQGEWHAILYRPSAGRQPTEEELACGIVPQLLYYLKLGAQRIYFWGIQNRTQGYEPEAWEYLRRRDATWIDIDGLFRASPYVEPRYPAVVFRNFCDNFSGEVVYEKEYRFGKVDLVRMRSGSGALAVLWHNEKSPVPVPAEVRSLLTPESEFVDFEGKKADPASPLRPGVYYYIRRPDTGALDRFKPTTADLYPQYTLQNQAQYKFWGKYRNGRLFDENLNVVSPETLLWQQATERQQPVASIELAESFAARFAVGMDDTAFDLLAEVHDKAAVPAVSQLPTKLYQDDSIQFAVDVKGLGRDGDGMEFQAARDKDGNPVLVKMRVPEIGGDLPSAWTPAGSVIPRGKVLIDRRGDLTVYRIRLPFSEFYPLVFQPFAPLRFSFLANNNDGKGRAGWVEWAGGIGGDKFPRNFGTLTAFSQPKYTGSLAGFSARGNAEVTVENGVLRCKVPQGVQGANGVTYYLRSQGALRGGRCRIRFTARGDAVLESLWNFRNYGAEKFKSRRFQTHLLSNGEMKFEFETVLPPDVDPESHFTFYMYNRSGTFEISDFEMTVE